MPVEILFELFIVRTVCRDKGNLPDFTDEQPPVALSVDRVETVFNVSLVFELLPVQKSLDELLIRHTFVIVAIQNLEYLLGFFLAAVFLHDLFELLEREQPVPVLVDHFEHALDFLEILDFDQIIRVEAQNGILKNVHLADVRQIREVDFARGLERLQLPVAHLVLLFLQELEQLMRHHLADGQSLRRVLDEHSLDQGPDLGVDLAIFEWFPVRSAAQNALAYFSVRIPIERELPRKQKVGQDAQTPHVVAQAVVLPLDHFGRGVASVAFG